MLERGDGTVEFRRHPGRELLDMVGPPLGAVVFLAAAVLMAPAGPIAVIGFGFFGLLMAVGSPASIRRGRKPILVVSPRGIETPEAGFLPWSQVAEVRIETERAMGGPGRHPRRIGIVPVEGARSLDPGLRLGTAMVDGFLGFASRAAGEGDRLRVDRAPFSVADWELQVPIERAVDAIARYVPVVDAAARDARRATDFTSSAAGQPPLTPEVIREIDARLGSPAALQATPNGPGASSSVAATPATRCATFRRRPLSTEYAKLAQALLSLMFVPASFIWMTSGAGIDITELLLVFFVPFGAIVLVAGVRALFAFIRVARERRGRPETLIEVGSEGIRTPEAGPLAWDEIADVHVGGGSAEKSELVFVPHDPLVMPPSHGEWSWRAGGEGRPLRSIVVRAADLDADFDRLVDLVRSYRPVAER